MCTTADLRFWPEGGLYLIQASGPRRQKGARHGWGLPGYALGARAAHDAAHDPGGTYKASQRLSEAPAAAARVANLI